MKSVKTLKIVLNLALVGLLVWFLATHEQKIRASVVGRDSIQYWAAGKLLVHRQNPYSVPSVLALERSQGYTADRPLMLRPAFALVDGLLRESGYPPDYLTV